MKTPHRSVHPGKRVRVVLRDGTRFDDRFVGHTDRWLEFERHGRLMAKDLKVLIILKVPDRPRCPTSK